ncbi:hypothetical protein ACFV2Q_15705 [Streptomyces sp. NPDC059650]
MLDGPLFRQQLVRFGGRQAVVGKRTYDVHLHDAGGAGADRLVERAP